MFSTSRPFHDAARFGALLLAWVVAGSMAQAQDLDPPGRVARLAETTGQVWVYTPESGDWIAAQRNQVLTTGDALATDGGARAELQVGSTTVRLDAGTEVGITRLDDDHLVLQLQQGAAIARLRDTGAATPLEVDSDQGHILVLRPGTYRIGEAGGRSDVTVYAGEARYEGANSALPVEAGQRAEFWIDASGVAQYSTLAPSNDDFLAWSAERDRRELAVVAERYVSPEMTGVADLDTYGRWEQSDDYGPLWIPAVSADWAPYGQGHWAWVEPWGWTWIDDAPWGFAPFHYGRWVHVHDNWCWAPGARVARPIYAPALVGWVGGPRPGVGGVPVVGWLPLGPREVYVPDYRASSRYAERINLPDVGSTEVIRGVVGNPQGPRDFQNRRFPRALTFVPTSVMTDRRPVGPASAELRQAPWARDLPNGPARLAPLASLPAAAPAVSRGQETRTVPPPPGFPARTAVENRPPATPSPRDRSPNDRDRGGRESHDFLPVGRVPPSPPGMQPRLAPPPPSNSTLPSYPAQAPVRAGIGLAPLGGPPVPPPPISPQPARPAIVQQAPAPQPPNMRPLPVYRSEPSRPAAPVQMPMAPAPARVDARPPVVQPQAPVQRGETRDPQR